jgi:hypothetical protein
MKRVCDHEVELSEALGVKLGELLPALCVNEVVWNTIQREGRGYGHSVAGSASSPSPTAAGVSPSNHSNPNLPPRAQQVRGRPGAGRGQSEARPCYHHQLDRKGGARAGAGRAGGRGGGQGQAQAQRYSPSPPSPRGY